MTPPTTAKVQKLILLKVPYAELRPYRRELVELHLDFLLWDWNCVSASICKEMMNKNRNEGDHLKNNSMLWRIEHWTKDEEKRFPKEREVRAIESSEDTDEEDNVQPEESPQRTARGQFQVDVVATREQP
ncbi:hypothetical protein AXG93_1299s1220 [Marchantia polymorpha subsp. ruderalis]|uniref:Uncharacterized protein n=1 Tax=Marchantia polymorpha subsp. ruderalis TaxID=1480154 RepID=A0A176WMY8_MARPO|nr:hypothetical protein AXG93_1299s1220 [Marchantia polymorpha subsp. ruderalis]